MPRFSTTHSCTLVDTMLRKVSSPVVKWTWTWLKNLFSYLLHISSGYPRVSKSPTSFLDAVYEIALPDVESWRCEFQIQMIFSSKNSCLSICSHHHHFEVYISQRRCFDLCKMYMMTQNFFEVFNRPYDLVLTLFKAINEIGYPSSCSNLKLSQ